MNVDIAILQETKLTDGVYTRNSSGYSIVASDAPSKHKGGLALCWKESRLYELEETTFLSPHVLTFRLITGGLKYYVVGVYIPPSSTAELTHIRRAYANCPEGFKPILAGDLNIDLESPRDERDEEIAEQVDWMDLGCMSTHFAQ
jgi:exonuclease III